MERRGVQRIKRRLSCEFLHEGNRHRGIVVDLSPGGPFLQTETSLEPGSEFGRDLSVGGMRIEPHPELALGDRIRLALYEPSSLEAILLDATVHRDDREQGLALRFDDVTPEARDRLERMVSELPSIDGPFAEEEPPKPLVVSEIVSE